MAQTTQPGPVTDPGTRMIHACWKPTIAVTAQGWPEGLYLLEVTGQGGSADGRQLYVPLVVRSTSTSGRVVMLSASATYAAYNEWGGRSLYGGPFDGDGIRKLGQCGLGLDTTARSGPAEATTDSRSSPDGDPENSLTGTPYECFPARGDYVVSDPAFPSFKGTGATAGTTIPGLVGAEIDRAYPISGTPSTVQVVSHSPVQCGGLHPHRHPQPVRGDGGWPMGKAMPARPNLASFGENPSTSTGTGGPVGR